MKHRNSLLLMALLLLLGLNRAYAQTAPTVLWPGEVVLTGYTTTGGAADWASSRSWT